MFIFTIICSLFINKKKEYTDESRFYRFLLETTTAIAVFFGRIHLHVTGLEKVPEDRKFLFVQNHRSNFDPRLSWLVFKKSKLIFITKPKNFTRPVFGAIIWRLRFIGIDRDNSRNALKAILKAADYIKKGDTSVGLYPEGTRNRGEDAMLPFRHGSLKIAQMAKCPIVVTTMMGSANIAKNFPWRATDVYVDVLDVIEPETFENMATVDLGEHIRDMMMSKVQERLNDRT